MTKLIASFEPEVWINDNAVPIDEPTCEWDVTSYLARFDHTHPYWGHRLGRLERDGEVIDIADAMIALVPSDECRAHACQHPFTIRIRKEES